jgi:hypothetical protein
LRQQSGLDEVLDWERMALVDLRVVDHRHHRVEATLSDIEDFPNVRLNVFTPQNVRRDCCRGRGDRYGLMMLFVQMLRSLWMRWNPCLRLWWFWAKTGPRETAALSRFC